MDSKIEKIDIKMSYNSGTATQHYNTARTSVPQNKSGRIGPGTYATGRGQRVNNNYLAQAQARKLSKNFSVTHQSITGTSSKYTYSSTEIYLGNLPSNVTKMELEKHVVRYTHGQTNGIKLMHGSALVKFDSGIEAYKAFSRLPSIKFKGKRIDVEYALVPKPDPIPLSDRYLLYIHGLPSNTAALDLSILVRTNAQVQVLDAEAPKNTGKSYGLVEFSSMEDREKVLDALQYTMYKGGKLFWARDLVELAGLRQHFVSSTGDKQPEPNLSHTEDNNDNPLTKLAHPEADLSLLATSNSSRNDRPDQIYITHTISQDLSGTAEEVMSLRLAALGQREIG